MRVNLRKEKIKRRVDSGVILVCAALYAANRFALRPILQPGQELELGSELGQPSAPGLGAGSEVLRLFFDGYFNDILVIPVLCAFMGLWTTYLGMKSDVCSRFRQLGAYMAHPQIVFPFTLIAGFFWEYVTPLYLRGSVGDPMDLVMYLIGACLYLITVRVCFFAALRRKVDTMYCNHCGKELPDDSAYCCYCGKAVGGLCENVHIIELFPDDRPVQIRIVDIGPNRNDVKAYLEDKVTLEVYTYNVTPLTRNDSAFIGEFSWDESMKILEDLRGLGCKAEIHLIDESTERMAARNYKPEETPAAPREPLSFGGVVGAVVVGGLICVVILSFF